MVIDWKSPEELVENIDSPDILAVVLNHGHNPDIMTLHYNYIGLYWVEKRVSVFGTVSYNSRHVYKNCIAGWVSLDDALKGFEHRGVDDE